MLYKTPGVFIEEISKFPPSVAQVETAIPAFIGYTEKASKDTDGDLLRVPTRIKSLLDYETLFGGPLAEEVSVLVGTDNAVASVDIPNPSLFRMYYALRMFFDNGGGPCYIVSIGDYTSDTSVQADVLAAMGTGTSPTGGISLIKKVDEVTLFVFPDAQILEGTNYHSLYQAALSQCATLGDRFTLIDLRQTDPAFSFPTTAIDFFRNSIGTNNLKYGAAYWPWLKTPISYHYDNESVSFSQPDGGDGNPGPFDALTLATVETITATDTASLNADEQTVKSNFTNEAGKDLAATIATFTIEMAPAASIAGVYAAVDSSRGVWKAPANVSLNGVIGPTEKLDDQDQADLNVHSTGKSVNAIRSFTGKGTLVWGARTLAGNDNEWRYVPVRRFYNMVEESVKKASSSFVFEPNDANTWVKVRAMIENFLLLQWRAGALQGAKPEQAFFVKVGLGETMTPQDILEGRMIVEIGMAVVRPAEFIILRFSHKMQEA